MGKENSNVQSSPHNSNRKANKNKFDLCTFRIIFLKHNLKTLERQVKIRVTEVRVILNSKNYKWSTKVQITKIVINGKTVVLH